MSYTITAIADMGDDILAQKAAYSIAEVNLSPADYGVPIHLAAELADASQEFADSMTQLAEAEAAYRVAVQSKSAARLNLVNKIRAVYPMCYANPEVSNAALAQILLAPRTPKPNFVAPTQPLHLVATPLLDGAVQFTWNRSGNTSSTVFQLERKNDEGEWVIVWSGSRRSALLHGFPPGIAATFRVVAVKGEMRSLPSPSYSIYSSVPKPEMRLVA